VKFIFHRAVHELGVRGVYFNIHGMQNAESADPRIVGFVADQMAKIPNDLEQSDAITGFAALHGRISARARKLRASPENLLMYFRKHGDLPRINGIVDVYNAVSTRSGIAIGAHDLRYINGDVELRLTLGNETFRPLGASEAVSVPPAEYAYVDGAGDILCRLEVRQVEKTKILPHSRDAFFIVPGHDAVGMTAIEAAARDLQHACLDLFGGRLEGLDSTPV